MLHPFATVVIAHALVAQQDAPFSQAAKNLKLPNLRALLRKYPPLKGPSVPVTSLSTVAEHVLAWGSGQTFSDGLMPWAEQAARQLGLPIEAGQGWAFVDLCHWQVNQGVVSMAPMDNLQVCAEESDALLSAVKAYFLEDGIALHPLRPGRWLACWAGLQDLPTASLARVRGQAIDPWLAGSAPVALGAAANTIRRLQNEMQMLFYTHPVNASRSVPINSFWVSGTGTAGQSATALATHSRVDDRFSAAWHSSDVTLWCQAWSDWDAQLGASAVADCRYVMCGPTQSTIVGAGTPPASKWRFGWARANPLSFLVEP